MNGDLHRRTSCRLCDSTNLARALKLEPSPPANAFVKAPVEQPVYPLDLYLCGDCGHVQLLDVVNPEVLFRDYVYVSGTSPSFVAHFAQYARAVRAQYNLTDKNLVLEVGSNDGTLLKAFQAFGVRTLGVDPAREIAKRATAEGIETIGEFFTPQLAEDIASDYGEAQVVVANNVFAHIDDLANTLYAVQMVLKERGTFIFEVQYLGDLVEKRLFDMVYHEHLSYHSLRPLIPFLHRHNFTLMHVERVPTHGGSIRVHARFGDGLPSDAVADLVALEREAGLDKLETFAAFGDRISQSKATLTNLVSHLKSQGRQICAFGAPAKSTTLLHHFGIGAEVIDFICDDSALKQGLYSPGKHIPVVAPEVLYEREPDYCLVTAWNFWEPIIQKHKAYMEGGHFIRPLPNVEVTA